MNEAALSPLCTGRARRGGVGLALALLAGCASVPADQQVFIFHGPEEVLDRFVSAATDCRYTAIDKALGSHVEPIVVLTIPRPVTPEYRCTFEWAKAHAQEGLTNVPRP